MTIAIASALTVAVILYIIGIRSRDLPEPEPVSPFQHLDERKAAIYENLRDLQFEYRLGKLSDSDYQQVKASLQKELATVMAEVDKIKARLAAGSSAAAANAAATRTDRKAKSEPNPAPAPAAAVSGDAVVCPHCNARFEREMKFCGECGKSMGVPV
jgi:hypothetical protein